jgi:hypothetical protein
LIDCFLLLLLLLPSLPSSSSIVFDTQQQPRMIHNTAVCHCLVRLCLFFFAFLYKDVGGGSTSMDNPSMAVDLPTEPTSAAAAAAAMHPRLHRQKLQSKTNRGKTFRSMKNNKAVANIEVRFLLIHFIWKLCC